jgi:hypothetical protein
MNTPDMAPKKPTTPRKPPVDTTGWLTRAQASDLMRVSVFTLVAWERRGLVHPAKAIPKTGRQARAVVVYNPDELAKLPQYRRAPDVPKQIDPGERTARAFELFDQGKSVREAVIELRETVGRTEELHQQWHDLGGINSAIPVAGQTRTELETILGAFESGEELLARVRVLIDRKVP